MNVDHLVNNSPKRSRSKARRCPTAQCTTNLTLTDHIIRQGKTLVRAIEALSTIEPTGPFERAATRLLLYVYKRRLRGVADGGGGAERQ